MVSAKEKGARMKLIESRYSRAFLISMLLFFTGAITAFAQEAKTEDTPKPTLAVSPVDPSKFAVIISGVSGEPQYAEQFNKWTAELKKSLGSRLGFAPDHINVLTEKPADGSVVSSAEQVEKTVEKLRQSTKSESAVFVFFIGHGSFDGKQSKFNLVGPDLTASDYAKLFSELPTKHLVVVDMSSASGDFIKPLSGGGHIVVTATKSGQEQNATRFAENFIAALSNPEADTDQNGRISILEAFTFATKATAKWYEDQGRLATEHALLDDNGDGVGHSGAEGGDGPLAKTTYFDSLPLAIASSDPEMAKLVAERDRLEREVEQLKTRKASMKPEDYDSELEKLLVDLAKVSQSIKGKQKPGN
jgi:hypothetical protein